MDYSALSDDARGYRKAAREQVKDMQRLSEEIRAELMRPEWRHDKVLENTSGLPAPAPTTTPTTEFHLTAKLVTDPNIARDAESQALEDEFTKDYVLDEEIDLSHLTNNRL